MNDKLRIHSHPWMEKRLSVPTDHVIIDADLYIELVKRFGARFPSLSDLSYEDTINFMRDRITNATGIPEHMMKGNPK